MRRLGPLLILIATVLGGFSHWFIVWLIASRLGSAALGEYSVVLAVATPLYVIAGLGLRNVFLTLPGAPPWATFFALRIVGSLAAAGVMLLYALTAAPDWKLIVGVIGMKSADAVLDIVLGRAQRAHRLVLLGTTMIANALLSMAAVVLVLLGTSRVELMLLASGSVSVLCALSTWWLTRGPGSRFAGQGERRPLRDVVTSGFMITLTAFAASVIASIPVWFLEATSTPAEVGRFSALAYVVVLANLVGASIQTTLIPTYRSVLETGGATRLLQRARAHTRPLLVLGPLAGVVLVLAGDWLFTLIYGAGFGATRLELTLYALACIFTIVSYVWQTVLLVRNRYRLLAATTIAAVAGCAGLLVVVWVAGVGGSVAAVASLALAYAIRCALSVAGSLKMRESSGGAG